MPADGSKNYKAIRENAARELLLYICEHKELPESAYSDWDMAEVVQECVDIGYLENVRTVRTLDGRVHPASSRPFVSRDGLAFLCQKQDATGETGTENCSIEAIAAELTRMNDNVRQNHAEEKSEKKKDRCFQLLNTMFGALLGAIFTLLVEHWPAIINLLSELFG